MAQLNITSTRVLMSPDENVAAPVHGLPLDDAECQQPEQQASSQSHGMLTLS